MNKAEKGKRAERLLQNEILVGALDEMRDNILKKFEDLRVDDTDGLRTLKLQQHALRELRRLLELYVTQGKRQEHEEALNG